MKAKLSALHLLSAILALGFLAGCEKTSVTVPDSSQTAMVSTLAGNGEGGFADGPGGAAQFGAPLGIAADTAGNLYVADTGNHRIRKITPAGEVSTLAGGEKGYADGTGSAARFYEPSGIAIDAAGNLYVTDGINLRIRKVTPDGAVSTLAGDKADHAKDHALQLQQPSAIAIDAAGNLYVADGANHLILKVTPTGKVSTLAGGEVGFADGTGGVAQFSLPSGIAIDAAGNLYVADMANYRIRKITPAGEVSTLADGTESAAQFNGPAGIAIDATGNLYVTDDNYIRKITPAGDVSTLAGRGKYPGYAEGLGSAAQFNYPHGIAMDIAGNLYVADRNNNRIRKIVIAGTKD
ncbi:MAG: SMP-30/gluconolactonase/LRE family protein [Azoarcus sp.]|jgi:DNA-binding beta-propeller fold protein YncE|nr:SMP-30/gluconolactonase/LRE family protein [Azoarcus sp.]